MLMANANPQDLNQQAILDRNEKIDRGLVERDHEIRKQLKDVGEVQRGSDYRLSPPLGDTTILLYNH